MYVRINLKIGYVKSFANEHNTIAWNKIRCGLYDNLRDISIFSRENRWTWAKSRPEYHYAHQKGEAKRQMDIKPGVFKAKYTWTCRERTGECKCRLIRRSVVTSVKWITLVSLRSAFFLYRHPQVFSCLTFFLSSCRFSISTPDSIGAL